MGCNEARIGRAVTTVVGPKAKSNGRPLAQQLSGVKLTNHEEDADQPFLRINEVARTVGA